MLRGAGDRAGLVQRSGVTGSGAAATAATDAGMMSWREASRERGRIEPQGALSTAPAQTRPGPPLPLTQTLELTERQRSIQPELLTEEVKEINPFVS